MTATTEHEQKLNVYARILDRLGPVETVLDVGCGGGGLVNFLVGHLRARVTGLDVSDQGFPHARQDAADAAMAGLMDCVQGDAEHMTAFEDERFEAVTMTYTLHHVEHREAALREIHRVLRPGGNVLIGDYVIVDDGPSSECHRLTVAEMRRMVEVAGFVGVDVEMIDAGVALLIGRKAAGGTARTIA